MFIILIHLICSILSRLVALDESDGLLNFKTFLQPIPHQYEGTNAPLVIAIVLCSGIILFLVDLSLSRKEDQGMTDCISESRSGILLSVCSGPVSVARLDETQHHAYDSEALRRHEEAKPTAGLFSLLRRTRLLRAKARRSIAYAFAYTVTSGLCNSIASSISGSYTWLTLAELATVVLLKRIHF